MSTFFRPTPFRRFVSALLSALLAFGPGAAAAAPLTGQKDLADEPIKTSVLAPPNIMLTVDDSTTMLYDFLPDHVIDDWCRGPSGERKAVCGNQGKEAAVIGVPGTYVSPAYIYQQYNYPYKKYGDGAGAFGESGPGAGCDLRSSSPRCSTGTDPTTADKIGLDHYPTASSAATVFSPPSTYTVSATVPYEYWLLWPAPVHNSAFNKLYYNPLLTYDPPRRFDGVIGVPLPQMNRAGTAVWTSVPTDSDWWATGNLSSAAKKVSLMEKVTVGQWCNSDWTLGNDGSGKAFVDNPAFCRTNGTVDLTSTPPATGDYSYPWAPTRASTGLRVLANDVTWKTGASNAPTADWQALQGDANAAEYFYQNENVIWCNVNSAAWPRGSTSGTQVCNFPGPAPLCTGATTTAACTITANGTCPAVASRTCAAPGCVYPTGTCNNITQTQTCGGGTQAACTAVTNTCGGGSSGTCNTTTNNCSATSQVCNVSSQTCKQNSATCADVWEPAGCNLVPPNPENPAPCALVNRCKSFCSIETTKECTNDVSVCTAVGKCSVDTAKSCTAATQSVDCPFKPGTCSIAPNGACNSKADCTDKKACSNSASTSCTTNAECANLGMKCSDGGAACTPANASTVCTNKNHCGGVVGGAACTISPNNCAVTGKTCSITGTACTTTCANAGTCSNTGSACLNNAACTATTGTCPATNGIANTVVTCKSSPSVLCGKVCGNSQNNGASCTSTANCTALVRVCNTPGYTTTTCSANTECAFGTCNAASQIPGNPCTTANQATKCVNKTGTCDANSDAATVGKTCPATTCVRKPGTCSVTGAGCMANSDCKDGLANATCSSTGVIESGVTTTKTLFDDANGAGLACRRNNMSYSNAPSVAAGRNNYPDATFNVPVTGGSTAGKSCVATPRYREVPRHYWKTSVEWCSEYQGSGKWAGYGRDNTCQTFKDETHAYPRFYKFGQPAGTENLVTPAFQRMDLDATVNPNFDHGLDASGKPVMRTFDEEMTNYANWFAYYRTRILAVKTVTSLAFDTVLATKEDKFRVGLNTLSQNPVPRVAVATFSTNRTQWTQDLFGIGITVKKVTPILDAMARVGELFKQSGEPITLACQKNWHMLFTDGLTYQNPPVKDLPDQDDTVPTLPTDLSGAPHFLVPGLAWPAPYRENPQQLLANTAADYSTYYWATDLRGDLVNNVTSTVGDPASWQHINFAAISLGTQGKLLTGDQKEQDKILAAVSAGSTQWPQLQPLPCTPPAACPAVPNQPDETGVDDLWHATVNARGRFVNAQSAEEVRAGMAAILSDISEQSGARAGVAFTSVDQSDPSLGNNFVYRVKFESGWHGSLAKIRIDPYTGKEVEQVWAAEDQLEAKLNDATGPVPGWSKRVVVTRNKSGQAIPFRWADAGGSWNLAPDNAAHGSAVLEYLRGNKDNEGDTAGQFRKRALLDGKTWNRLGDIVNSQPVYVGMPNAPYEDGTDPGYSTFKGTTRGPRIYVGANDGMLHAFDDSGNESWAYIPYELNTVPEVVQTEAKSTSRLGWLAFQVAPPLGYPQFLHRYLVDGQIRVGDINAAGAWHSVLVGGLGKGGKAYYAVDVTAPDAVTTEAEAASRLLWDFDNSKTCKDGTTVSLGYSFGKPLITKTRAFGGKWLAVVSSGYINDGHGYLYFLDAWTGECLKGLATNSSKSGDGGTLTNQSGLAQFAGYTKNYKNFLTEQIYAGDLQGNFWRFDVSSDVATDWVVEKLADFEGQPVTTPPQIEVDIANGVDRWVFVGTGRLLHPDDLKDQSQQTMYALRDGTTLKPWCIDAARSSCTVNRAVPVAPIKRGLTGFPEVTDAVGLSKRPDIGWYDNLPTNDSSAPGQRIIVPPQAAVSVVAYIASYASEDPCVTGLPARVYVRGFSLGDNLIDASSGSGRDNGQAVELLDDQGNASGGVGIELISLAKAEGDGSVMPSLALGITQAKDGRLQSIKVNMPTFVSKHRMSWRLIGD